MGADHRYKASAFLVFPDIGDACDATTVLRQQTSVDAVEIFDRRSLKLCAEMEPNPNANPTLTLTLALTLTLTLTLPRTPHQVHTVASLAAYAS